ncbi:MAG TPA: hypothetical protein VF240_07755 [Pyrinomonadaceae bacterium]
MRVCSPRLPVAPIVHALNDEQARARARGAVAAGRPERGDEAPMVCKHLFAAAVVHGALSRMDSRAMGRSTRICRNEVD